jgi:putative sterol carrier protein
MERARPPHDMAPSDFFLDWVPSAVAGDPARSEKLADVDATIQFTLAGPEGGIFCIRIVSGQVQGTAGAALEPDLRVELAVETWRKLNRGELSAPEAVLKRSLKFHGNFLLALRLHLILG